MNVVGAHVRASFLMLLWRCEAKWCATASSASVRLKSRSSSPWVRTNECNIYINGVHKSA